MKKKTALWGVFLALALIFSYIEMLIPISFAVPGIKLGLANLVTLLVLYRLGWKDAFMIAVFRAILAGFLFGNLAAILYSLSGGILSLIIMQTLKRTEKFSVLFVSISGGIFHNIGQIMMAILILKTSALVSYLPVLVIAGGITGMLIGLLGDVLLKRLPENHLF